MQWMIAEEQLDGTQRTIVNDCKRAPEYFYVSGAPGTGKSVLLVHFVLEARKLNPLVKVCVLTYTHALRKVLVDGLRTDDVPVMTLPAFYHRYKASYSMFDIIVVDEVQDMQHAWANVIQRNAPKILFFGDFGQRLYEDAVSEPVFLAQFKPDRKSLDLIHRLPPTIRDLVNHLFPGTPIHTKVSNLAGDAEIQLCHADSTKEEFAFLARTATDYSSTETPVGALFRHNCDIKKFLQSLKLGNPPGLASANGWLRKKGSIFRFLGNDDDDKAVAECDQSKIVFLMTWHSAKGLDFEHVFLPCFQETEGLEVPLYVALTRSRRNLIISYSGEETPLIKKVAAFHGTKKFEAGEYNSFEGGLDDGPVF